MRKKMICIVGACIYITTLPAYPVYAKSPYEGNEGAWLEKCSVAQSSEEDAQACRDFKTYYSQQSDDLENKVADMQKSSDSLNEDLSNLQTLINDLDSQMDALNAEIATAQTAVTNMQTTIDALDVAMVEKQEEIETIDTLIKARMVSEQANIGTNRYIDVIMGASDLMDFVRLVEGINLITESDQGQIEAAAKVRSELALQQDEQERLKADKEQQLEDIKERENVVAQGKVEKEKLYNTYYKKQQDILQMMETAKADISSMQGSIAGINTNVRDDIFQPTPPDGDNGGGQTPGGSTGWIKPISYAWYCGTWYYPNSSLVHVGADYSGPSGAPVYAPANSIVLYANAPYGANEYGYLLGWPYGGGNTMHLLTQVDNVTYGISYFHLSPGYSVSVGDFVEQGQMVARSGSSGNVTGPHLHVEVINLGNMSVTQAQAQFASTADFAWGTGWGISSSCEYRGAPCRERPENLFGY